MRGELIAVADEHLGEYEHRRLDFELAAAGERVRAELEAARWEPTRLIWMLHSGELPRRPGAGGGGGRLRRGAADAPGLAPEDFPEVDTTGYLANARELAMTRDVRVIASRQGDELVGFAQVARQGDARRDHPDIRATRASRGRPRHRDHPRGD